jgi:hypothetical protein
VPQAAPKHRPPGGGAAGALTRVARVSSRRPRVDACNVYAITCRKHHNKVALKRRLRLRTGPPLARALGASCAEWPHGGGVSTHGGMRVTHTPPPRGWPHAHPRLTCGAAAACRYSEGCRQPRTRGTTEAVVCVRGRGAGEVADARGEACARTPGGDVLCKPGQSILSTSAELSRLDSALEWSRHGPTREVHQEVHNILCITKPMVLVSYKPDNYIGILQTKSSDREGHEARRIGL